MTKRKKITIQQKQGIAGIGFLAIGLYMILGLNEVRGTFPLSVGIGILLWRAK